MTRSTSAKQARRELRVSVTGQLTLSRAALDAICDLLLLPLAAAPDDRSATLSRALGQSCQPPDRPQPSQADYRQRPKVEHLPAPRPAQRSQVAA